MLWHYQKRVVAYWWRHFPISLFLKNNIVFNCKTDDTSEVLTHTIYHTLFVNVFAQIFKHQNSSNLGILPCLFDIVLRSVITVQGLRDPEEKDGTVRAHQSGDKILKHSYRLSRAQEVKLLNRTEYHCHYYTVSIISVIQRFNILQLTKG